MVERGGALRRAAVGVKGGAALFSGDSSYGDKCGEMWCGNVNIDKPITG